MGQLATAATSTQLRKATPANDFKSLLSSQWDKIAAVMPMHMNRDRMFQLAVSSYNQTPDLAECTTQSVLSCVMKCASLGLEPSAVDGLGRAYILPYYNGKTKRKEAQFILGYKGMIDLARRSGQLKSIHAQAVYVGDEFDYWEDENGQHFTYRPDRTVPREPKNLTDVYVNIQLKDEQGNDNGFIFETMTRAEVDAIRDRSKSGKSGYSPWATDYEAMALKTVIRRAFKYMPVSVSERSGNAIHEAIAADETTPDYGATLDPIIEVEAEEQEQTEPEPKEVG